VWSTLALADRGAAAVVAELIRFVTTPRATQAMVRGSGVTVGRFRPSIHVTLWS
ncbi:MAG: LysR family transcriptional regulator, low CO2-responsive transcriptional regulator, partial [Pseudonocardiales bacterium]|nr:LysR family transcriptional regulator, low CO2-responsive transcriptional regulator [Pseudonocardiales bacterium]